MDTVRSCRDGIGDDGATIGIDDGANRELRRCRHRDGDANQSVLEQNTVGLGVVRCVVGAIGTVERGEERVAAAGQQIARLDRLQAEPHRVANSVAGSACTPVGPQALKEGVVLLG